MVLVDYMSNFTPILISVTVLSFLTFLLFDSRATRTAFVGWLIYIGLSTWTWYRQMIRTLDVIQFIEPEWNK